MVIVFLVSKIIDLLQFGLVIHDFDRVVSLIELLLDAITRLSILIAEIRVRASVGTASTDLASLSI